MTLNLLIPTSEFNHIFNAGVNAAHGESLKNCYWMCHYSTDVPLTCVKLNNSSHL